MVGDFLKTEVLISRVMKRGVLHRAKNIRLNSVLHIPIFHQTHWLKLDLNLECFPNDFYLQFQQQRLVNNHTHNVGQKQNEL